MKIHSLFRVKLLNPIETLTVFSKNEIMGYDNPGRRLRAVFFIALRFALCAALYAQNTASAGPGVNRERGQINAEPLWRQALGGAVTCLPSVQAQSVVAALDGGNIKAYSASGRPLWNYSARGKLSPFVTRSREGTSYISRINGTFIAVNRTGRELWRLNPGGQLSAPALSGWDGRIFIPTGKRISCYTASGVRLWAKDFDERITLAPRLDRAGGILFALENGEAVSLNAFGGARSWKNRETPQALLSLEPGTDRETRTMALFKNGAVEILEEREDWYIAADSQSFHGFPRLSSPPLAAAARGSLAAVTLEDGRVALLSADDGKILWTGDSHIAVLRRQGKSGGGDCEMVYDERGIYVLSRDGATGFTSDGKRLWFITLENTSALPAFSDEGILYSGGNDWILYAYALESRPPVQEMQLFGPAPEGSYGTGSPPPSPWSDYLLRFDEDEIRRSLDEIAAAIQSGNTGENELAWTAYLMEIITAEYSRPGASVTLQAVQIRDRLRALLLLSRIGSRETIPFMTGVFKKESDPVMKAAAARAIGAIGADSSGAAMQAFLDAVSSPGGLQDAEVLLAIAQAAGALCRFSGPPLSGAGAKILTRLSSGSFPQAVRRQAVRELAALRLEQR